MPVYLSALLSNPLARRIALYAAGFLVVVGIYAGWHHHVVTQATEAAHATFVRDSVAADQVSRAKESARAQAATQAATLHADSLEGATARASAVATEHQVAFKAHAAHADSAAGAVDLTDTASTHSVIAELRQVNAEARATIDSTQAALDIARQTIVAQKAVVADVKVERDGQQDRADRLAEFNLGVQKGTSHWKRNAAIGGGVALAAYVVVRLVHR
jgi:hypothetical protein